MELISGLKRGERPEAMRSTLRSLPQDFISSRHSLVASAGAPLSNCTEGDWVAWVDALRDKKLRRIYLAMTGNVALCFDTDVVYPVEVYPRSLKKFKELLPILWKALLSPLPVFELQGDGFKSLGPNLDGLGQQELSRTTLGVAESTSEEVDDAELADLQQQLVDRKRQRQLESEAELSAKRAKNILRKKELLAELAALDAPSTVTSLVLVPDAKDLKMAALETQVKHLSTLVASGGSLQAGSVSHSALSLTGGLPGAVHPWDLHSGLKAVSASSAAALSAHLKDATPGNNRGTEVVCERAKPKTWSPDFARVVHGVTQRFFPLPMLKDFAAGRYHLAALGYFLPFGIESRDRALQEFADRPAASDMFQAILDEEVGGSSRAKSSSSPSSILPANLLDFSTALDAFGRLLYLLRSPAESSSFDRFIPIFKLLLTSYPQVSVAVFVSLWSTYLQETMRVLITVEFDGGLANRFDWDSSERITNLKFMAVMANDKAAAARQLRQQQDVLQKERQKKAAVDAERILKAARRQQQDDRNGGGNGVGHGGRGGNGGRGGRGNGGRGNGGLTDVIAPVEVDDGAAATAAAGSVTGAVNRGACKYGLRCHRLNSGCLWQH